MNAGYICTDTPGDPDKAGGYPSVRPVPGRRCRPLWPVEIGCVNAQFLPQDLPRGFINRNCEKLMGPAYGIGNLAPGSVLYNAAGANNAMKTLSEAGLYPFGWMMVPVRGAMHEISPWSPSGSSTVVKSLEDERDSERNRPDEYFLNYTTAFSGGIRQTLDFAKSVAETFSPR